MTALERLLKLQQEGQSEQQIINSLREEGFQTTEISDALNQAKIKSAVSQEQEPTPEYQESQPSTFPEQSQTSSEQSYPSPQTTSYENYASPTPTDQTQQYPEYGQQVYDSGGYYAQQTSTDTMTDIAEQVVNKKMQELSKILEKVVQTTNSTERELNDIKEKVKRIEDSLDSIQKAIISKIGEFGESTKLVQKDLENIHGTMSKMMNPLIDNYNELKRINSKK